MYIIIMYNMPNSAQLQGKLCSSNVNLNGQARGWVAEGVLHLKNGFSPYFYQICHFTYETGERKYYFLLFE